MIYQSSISTAGASVAVAEFIPSGSGVREWHVVATSPAAGTFASQLRALLDAVAEFEKTLPAGTAPLMRRYFLSDAANQAVMLPEEERCAVSVVEQAPLHGGKCALWSWYQEGAVCAPLGNGAFLTEDAAGKRIFIAGATKAGLDAHEAAAAMLEDLHALLGGHGMTLEDHCTRTWFFVQNVDVNYAGVVEGRNEVFARHGLTPATHFIASTGIGGRHTDPRRTVVMDAVAEENAPHSLRHLYAPTHLNPTYEYGVAFERGSYIDRGDRRHVYISGTASIDNRGEIVHPGDITGQTARMTENIGKLLEEAGADWSNVGHLLIYLRDLADAATVEEEFRRRLPDVPHVILLAPVCRPGWLIETECMATLPLDKSKTK